MLARMWRNGNSLAMLVGMQIGAATLENSVEGPQKIKNRITLQPINGTSRNLSKGYSSADAQGHMYPNVYSSSFDKSQIIQSKFPSTNKWIKKMLFIYTMEYCLAMRKNEILSFGTMWMELEGTMLSEINQSEKDTYVFIYMWNLRNLAEDHRGREGIKIVSNREGGKP